MSFEPCTFSPESGADCLPISSWDTGQLSLLSGNHTPAKSCENEPQKVGSPACMCGKGTLGCSIHPSTPEAWTAFMRDSLAKTLALLESRQAYLREPEAAFTAKSSESLAWFDRDTCSWKTYQQSFLTDSEPYSQTWPRWGMTLGGAAYAHPMSERRISAIDGGYLPTMLVSTGTKWWARDDYHSNLKELASLERFSHLDGQYLSLEWAAWMMGFPIAWASSKATATRKYRSKPQQHGDCSEVAE